MILAKIQDGKVVEYPLARKHLASAFPNVSFPAVLTDDILSDYGFAIVHATTPPEEDGKSVTEAEPVFDGSQWHQAWTVTDIPAEDLLAAERAAMTATRYQAKAALHLAGILDDVEALMADPETDALKAFEWQEKPVFRRTSPTITWAAQQLGLTETQVDDLFRLAATIEA